MNTYIESNVTHKTGKRKSNALNSSYTQKNVKMERKQARKNKAILRGLGA